MPTTETLLQSPTIDLIDDADLLWVWNSSASALTKATRASVVGDIDLLFSNGSDKQISINNSPAATVGRQLTVKAGNVASGTNLAGGNLDLRAGLGTGTGNSNLTFSTGQSTVSSTSVQVSTERMRITNSGDVGIGTASPGYRIDVDGGNVTQAARFYSSSAATTVIEVGGTGTTSIVDILLTSNSGTAEIWKSGTGGTAYGGVSSLNLYNSNGAIAFHPNNQQNAMFLDTSGRLGIGTTSPSTRLDIDNGALELAEMTAPGAGAVNTVRIYAVDNGSGKTQLMAIFNTGAAQQLAIQP